VQSAARAETSPRPILPSDLPADRTLIRAAIAGEVAAARGSFAGDTAAAIYRTARGGRTVSPAFFIHALR